MAGFVFQPILHEKYTQPITTGELHLKLFYNLFFDCFTVTATCAEVCAGHAVSDLVKQVNKLLPDEHLKHLKKIRRKDDGEMEILLGRSEAVLKLMQILEELPVQNLRQCQVPGRPPLTRQQFDECKTLWPTSFHEDKYVRKCLDGTRFSQSDKQEIYTIISRLNDRTEATGKNVTLIANRGKILVDEVDDSEQHPLHHSSVKAVNAISELQARDGGKGYICTSYDAYVSREPCLMCGMALLHSRIQRIFLVENSKISASCPKDEPFSRMKLHVNEMLNHRFEVWMVRKEN